MAYIFAGGATQRLSLAVALATAAPLTLHAWFKNPSLSRTLLSLDDGASTNYFALNVAGTPTITAYTASPGGGTQSATVPSYVSGVWCAAGGVYASATSRIAYFNGLGGTANTASVTPAGINETVIGDISAGASPFIGIMGPCAIWTAALTPREMLDLYLGKPANEVRPSNLVGYFTLDNDLRDYCGRYALVRPATVSAPDSSGPQLWAPPKPKLYRLKAATGGAFNPGWAYGATRTIGGVF